MNYQKIYDNIIERAKTRVLEGYKERHHIVPKCMGGSDDVENLVELTAREHFICHKLLVEMYPSNSSLNWAAWMMATTKDSMEREYKVSAREYQRLRENLTLSPEAIEKIKKARANQVLPPLTEEHKQRLREFNTGKHIVRKPEEK